MIRQREYETQVKEKKTYRLKHEDPGVFPMGYILLPWGYMYNTDIESAKKGQRIRFFSGEEYVIFCVKKISLKTKGTDLLCRIRYGITIRAALQRWRNNARLEGHGSMAVSGEECLWVIYEKEDDED